VTDHDFILAPQTVQVSIVLDQTYSMVNSLMMMNHVDRYSGLDPWLEKTFRQLPEARQQQNILIMGALFWVVKPEGSFPNLMAFVDHLASQNAEALRDKALEKLFHKSGFKLDADILTDKTRFVDMLVAEWQQKMSDEFDEAKERPVLTQLYELLIEPEAMQEAIVEHLQWMWEHVLADEWARVKPMLEESAAAYQSNDYSGLTSKEAIKAITGRDLHGIWDEYLNVAEKLIFIPTPHMGPYVGIFPSEKTSRILFGARLPEGSTRASSALSRSELLVRLNAIADDNRLRILELIAEAGELCAQEIIVRLDLSQSAASRHLRQLSATGYLNERTKQGAKCYTLSPERVIQTMQALRQFLGT
jgi:DNA-binding transcriptional ArsR family regulator